MRLQWREVILRAWRLILCKIPCHDVDVFVTQSNNVSHCPTCPCLLFKMPVSLPKYTAITCQREVVPLWATHLRVYKYKSASANVSLGLLLQLLLHCVMSAGNTPVLLQMFQACLCKDCRAHEFPCFWYYYAYANKTPLLKILECANVATACTNYHKTQAPVTKVENSQGHMCPTN